MTTAIPIVGSILICLALVVFIVSVMGKPDRGWEDE